MITIFDNEPNISHLTYRDRSWRSLTTKYILLAINWTVAFMRMLLWSLLIFMANEALKGHFENDTYFFDDPDSDYTRVAISGISAFIAKDGVEIYTVVCNPAAFSMDGLGPKLTKRFSFFDQFKRSVIRDFGPPPAAKKRSVV